MRVNFTEYNLFLLLDLLDAPPGGLDTLQLGQEVLLLDLDRCVDSVSFVVSLYVVTEGRGRNRKIYK